MEIITPPVTVLDIEDAQPSVVKKVLPGKNVAPFEKRSQRLPEPLNVVESEKSLVLNKPSKSIASKLIDINKAKPTKMDELSRAMNTKYVVKNPLDPTAYFENRSKAILERK